MNFAFASYLAGMAFLAVPIILHLLRLKPHTVKMFPSFYLLTRKIVKRQRRNSLLKYLVLFCRCAALAFFCLAFAWPYVEDIALEPERALVVIRDASFSTAAPQVRDALKQALQQELSNVSATAPALGAVVTDQVSWSGEFTPDRDALEAFFDLHESSQMTSGFLTALYQADSRLGAIPAKYKRITIITDRQALPWRRLPSYEFLRHADEVRVLPVPPVPPRRNAAVVSAKVETPYTAPGAELELTVRTANFNGNAIPCTLKVFLEDELKDTRETVLLPHSEKPESFKLKTPPGEPIALGGRVVLETKVDDIELDNTRYFAVNPLKAPDIYLTPRGNGYDFTRTALSGGTTREFPLDRKTLAGLPKTPAILIVRNCAELGSDAAARLDAALENGSSVVLVYRDSRDMRGLFKHFGIEIGKNTIRQTELEMVNFDHPIFREYLEVSVAAWFDISFFDVPELYPPRNARIIAAFNGDRPAVMEMNRGNGKLIVLAAPIEPGHTNFQTYGAFLPFWRELVQYCSSNARPENSFLTASAPLRLPAGELKRDKAGVFKLGDRAYCVNVNTGESDLAPIPDTFNYNAMIIPHNSEPEQQRKLDRLAGSKDYKTLMLALMLAFALVETLLSNRTVN